MRKTYNKLVRDNITKEQVEKARLSKLEKKGAFKNKILLKQTYRKSE